MAFSQGLYTGLPYWISEVVWMLILLDPTGVVQRSIVSYTFEIFVGLGPFMLAAAECSCSLFRSCLVVIHVDVGSGYEGCWFGSVLCLPLLQTQLCCGLYAVGLPVQ